MALGSLLRKMRVSLALLPSFGVRQVPSSPSYALRDLWRGDSTRGAHLLKGELLYEGVATPLIPGTWGNQKSHSAVLFYMHSFAWLRDMRELGSDTARLLARSLINDWINKLSGNYDSFIYHPGVIGNRLATWLGHYDFFVASADDSFRQNFMSRIMAEGRLALAMLPPESGDHYAFSLLKGVLAFALCTPDQYYLVPRIKRLLDNELQKQILEDGTHIERNPQIQFEVLQNLVEIRLMLQLIEEIASLELVNALDNVSRVLRALRHNDGGLALFNGANESNAKLIDMVLSQATQKRMAMTDMVDGGYIRCHVNRATLLIDVGTFPSSGNDHYAHASALAIEFSMGKQRIFVNCGSSSIEPWHSLLRSTAAHSVLVLEDTNSVSVQNRSTLTVKSDHHIEDGAHLVKMSHNGWSKSFGAIYHRILYLSANGEDLRGEEWIESERRHQFVVRFHLHPSIEVVEKVIEIETGKSETILVLNADNNHEGRQIWWFRVSGAKMAIEESIYAGQEIPVVTKQIVLYLASEEKALNNIEEQEVIASNEPDVEAKSFSVHEKEDNSDYVAIFSHQNLNQETTTNSAVAGSNQKAYQGLEEQQEDTKVDSQMIRWALHRKL